jgi:hypothetical protein
VAGTEGEVDARSVPLLFLFAVAPSGLLFLATTTLPLQGSGQWRGDNPTILARDC